MRRAMVHINCERNNAPTMWEVAVALHEACNGSHKLGERNNAPTLKTEKWNGDATVLWVVEKKLAQFTTAGRPNGRVGPAAIKAYPVCSALYATEKIPLPHLLLTHRW